MAQTLAAFAFLVLLDLAGIDIFDMKERAANSAAELLRTTVLTVIYLFSLLAIIAGFGLRVWGFLANEGADIPPGRQQPGAFGLLRWLGAIVRDSWVHRPRQTLGELFVVLGTLLILAGLFDTFKAPIRFATAAFEAASAADATIKLKIDRRQRFKLRSKTADGQCFVTFADSPEISKDADESRNEQRVIVPCGCLAKDQPLVLGPVLRGDSGAREVRKAPSMTSEIVPNFPSSRVLVGALARDGVRWLEVRGGLCEIGYVLARQRAVQPPEPVRPPEPERVQPHRDSTVSGTLNLSDDGVFWLDGRPIDLQGIVVDKSDAGKSGIADARRYLGEFPGPFKCDKANIGYTCTCKKDGITHAINTTLAFILNGAPFPSDMDEVTPEGDNMGEKDDG